MSGENVPQITILPWKQLLMTKGGNLENRRWKILGCPSEKYLVVQVRNTWTNRSHFWHIWTRQEINWALSIRRWPHATFTCMLQPCRYLLSHLWLYMYISCIYFTLTMNFKLLILCSFKLRFGKSDIFLRVSDEELRAGWHGNRDYSLTVIEPPPYLSGSHSLWQPSRHSRGRVGKKNSEERK